jgi:hypothetical protein
MGRGGCARTSNIKSDENLSTVFRDTGWQSVKFLLFNYFENRKAYRRSSLGIKCVSSFFSTVFFETVFARINTYMKLYARGTRWNAFLHIKYSLLSCFFSFLLQNWNISANFNETLQYKNSWKSFRPLFSCDVRDNVKTRVAEFQGRFCGCRCENSKKKKKRNEHNILLDTPMTRG